MAGTDSLVQINEGGGKYLHYIQRSIASNTEYQTAVVMSEAYLPTYTGTITTAIPMGANDHLFELQGSTLNRLILRAIEVTQLANASGNTSAAVQLMRTITAGTGGSPFTPVATDPTSPVTTATFRGGLSTNKGNESSVIGEWTMPVLATAATAGSVVFFREWADPRVQSPTIAAGNANGLAFKLITAVTTATLHITVTFSEVFWS